VTQSAAVSYRNSTALDIDWLAMLADCVRTRRRAGGRGCPRRRPPRRKGRPTVVRLTATVLSVACSRSCPGPRQRRRRSGLGSATRVCGTDTTRAGSTVKQLGLLEKHLPRVGKYAGAKYDIVWETTPRGRRSPTRCSPASSTSSDGRLSAVVNIARFQEMQSIPLVIVSMTG